MTVRQSLPRAIAETASDWILREEDGFSSQDRAAFEAWRAADPRHEEALIRLRALWNELDEAVPAPVVPLHRPVQRAYRKLVLPKWVPSKWMGAMAACVALVWLAAGEGWLIRLRADQRTVPGEQRTLHLADGSQVKMDSNTALAFDFTPVRRSVRLLGGRALFTVAADPGRPFVVRAGSGEVTALGTQFTVETEHGKADALVTEHRVLVRSGYGNPAIVGEGQTITWTDGGLGAVRKADVGADTAWTRGRLVVAGMPLREVVARIGRYRTGYAGVLGDAAHMRVSGVYDLARPDEALAALQKSLGLSALRISDRVVLLYR